MFLKWKNLNELALMLGLSSLIGILGGLGAILFRSITAFVHNLLFSGHLSFVYNEKFHTPLSLWGMGVIFVPVVAGFIVIGLIKRFAYDERGLSIPEIMHKVRDKNGKINPIVALTKTIASAISIGSGASVGREGPIIQIGAALSSLLSDFIRLSITQRKLLIAAGVAASMAAMFNAPLAGIAFSIELLLISFNFLSVLYMGIAAIAAIFIQYIFMGSAPIFVVETTSHVKNHTVFLIHLFLMIPFGVIVGVISLLFIRSVYWFEDLFTLLFKNPYLRHMMGMIFVGIMLYVLMRFYGHYYIVGVGFSTIQDCLSLLINNHGLLLWLVIGKLLATCLSLGTGASGGILSPALFLGATLGSLLGLILDGLFPQMGIHPVFFTLAGMAGILGGTTGAVVTAILLTAEMTRDLYSILPVIMTTTIAYLVRKQLCSENIYTLKLVRRSSKDPNRTC